MEFHEVVPPVFMGMTMHGSLMRVLSHQARNEVAGIGDQTAAWDPRRSGASLVTLETTDLPMVPTTARGSVL